MKRRMDGQVAFRCRPEDRAELKRISESLAVTESDVARAAFREGLKLVSNRGIQPWSRPQDPPQLHNER
jgi:hypothetical protein